MRRIRGIGSGRIRVLVALAIAGIAAATIGLSPVMAGKNDDPTRFSSAFEAGFVDHGFSHLSNKDVRGDKLRAARCAVPGYRATYPSKCPALSPKLRRSEARQRALCAKPVYRTRHPQLCPTGRSLKVDRAIKRALEQNPSVAGKWDPNLVQIDGLAINSILLPTGKILWFAYPSKPDFTPPHSPASDAAVNWAEAWVFDPTTGTSVRRNPPIDPLTNLPYNIWCSGQTLLRDGRVLVAGGNREYYSAADPKYKGHWVVLTFNPFNETWTVQPRMRHGRWYPTLTELSDGRVVIVAGLDEEPLNVGDNNNTDVEVFTPSPNLDGVGSIQLVKENEGFGLYPHVFLNTQGKLITVGPDETDSHIIDPSNWAFSSTQALLPYSTSQAAYPGQPDDGDTVGRREWGSAVMLPSGPEGPSTILMVGGSDAEASHYADPAQTNETLLVNMLNGSMVKGPSNFKKRSHVNTTILPDGTLFTNGGGLGSANSNQYAIGDTYDGELYNPATGTWTLTDAAQEERTYHSTSLLLPDGRVATMGDDRQENSQNLSNRRLEYYNPPYLFKGTRPTITSAPGGTPYGVPVGIGTPDAIAKAVIIKLGATTHALDTDQRSLSLNFAAAPGGISVTMPTSANAAPPGYYQLFLLNAAGVPSVSKMIRLDTGLPVPSAVPVIAGPGGGAAAFPAPKISKLKATVKFKKGFAIVKLSFKASKAFKGTVKLFPIPKAKKGKKAILIKKALVSKSVSGVGTKAFAATIRFSVKGKRFPLKLRMTIALKDKRGGTTRTTTKGLLLTKSPKPTARILARAR